LAQGSSCDPDISVGMTVRALSFFVLGFFLFAIQGCVDCAGLYSKMSACSAKNNADTSTSKTMCEACKAEWNAMKDMCSCKCKDMGTYTGTFSQCYDSSGASQDDKTMKDQLFGANGMCGSNACNTCGDSAYTTDALCP